MPSGSGSVNAVPCAYCEISVLMYGALELPYTLASASFSIVITKTTCVWAAAGVPLVPPVPVGVAVVPPVAVGVGVGVAVVPPVAVGVGAVPPMAAGVGGGGGVLPPVPVTVQLLASVNACGRAVDDVMVPAVSSIWNSSVDVSPQAAVSPSSARATDQVALPPVDENVALPTLVQLQPAPVER